MVPNFVPNSSLTVAEVFFAEKFLESVHYRTVDSYRTRLHNPRTILQELYQVLLDFQNNKIKSFSITIEPVKIEAMKLLEQEQGLCFDTIDKKLLLDSINSAKTRDTLKKAIYALKLVLNDNKNYCTNLFSEIKKQILKLNEEVISDVNVLRNLSELLNFLASELSYLGYDRSYLYKCIKNNFKDKSKNTFWDGFEKLGNLANRQQEDFKVIFKVSIIPKDSVKLQSEYLLEKEKIEEISKLNKSCHNFFSKRSNDIMRFIGITCNGSDYLAVIPVARKRLSTIIDAIHLGFPDTNVIVHSRALVVGKEAVKSEHHRIELRIDGHYRNDQSLYEDFISKLTSIEKKLSAVVGVQVAAETYKKLISAARYLRLGSEAHEVEQKFINYWIGLEYLFSNYDIEENTISRLKEHFINSHTLIYFKRNIIELHEDIKRLKIDDYSKNGESIEYLEKQNTYDEIIKKYLHKHPLLAYRASRIKEYIIDKKLRLAHLEKHRENLKGQLTRCYRVRNEIVHEAAIHTNISLITGNVRYYLTFMLNSLIEYLHTADLDIDSDGQITIDDFFMMQDLAYQNIKLKGYRITDLLSIQSATEIFS